MRRRWLAFGLTVGAVAAVARFRSRLSAVVRSLQTYSAPSATVYDTVAALAFGGFFSRVTAQLTEGRAITRVLDIGAGPGQLAMKVATSAPNARVVGLDVAPDMIQRASARAARSSDGDRLRLVLGDAVSLPFADGSFDAVITTFSLHHWPDPERGIAEMERVLRPGGVARVYDIADWVRWLERHGEGTPSSKLFGRGWTRTVDTRIGPVPLLYRAELTR